MTLYYNPYAADELVSIDSSTNGCGTTHGIADVITGVLNEKLRTEAEKRGFLVADFKTAFDGHGAGDDDPWVVGTRCDLSGAIQAVLPDWERDDDGAAGLEQRFDPHPNSDGTAATADTIIDALEGS